MGTKFGRSAALATVFALLSHAAFAQTADVVMNIGVDNAGTVYLSQDAAVQGQLLGTVTNWSPATNIQQALIPGVTNYIHIFAENAGTPSVLNPGAFLGELTLVEYGTAPTYTFANGTGSLLTSNAADGWLVGTAPPVASTPVFLADHGDGPWAGQPVANISPEADWIWLDPISSSQTASVIFTAAIIPIETDISLVVVDDPDPVLAGSGSPNLTHEVTVTNTGNDASGVVVSLVGAQIPDGVSLDSWTESVGTFDGTDWDIGDLADGASATLTLSLTVGASANSGDTVSATFSLTDVDQVDSDSSNDQDVSDPTSILETTDVAFTFATSIDPVEAGTPDVTISCNGGLPLTQTAPVGTTFTVLELTEGVVCTVTMGDLDGDWVGHVYECSGTGVATETGCEFTIDAEALASTVNILAIPAAFEYTANLTWEISPDADPGIEDNAMLMATCENVFVGIHGDNGPLTTTTVTVAGDMNTAAVIEALPDPDGSTSCYAELMGVGSAVEVMNGCGSETIEVGDGMVDCDIMATAFYEGIPTLSQYGLALMALLMLGVGFFGFRRFV
ncbi:MAG: DUF11 domain-containing protein [Xanthomonadales bacterium]|jgi:hypothetical protein|nr:DUF11 domain-containing protein [Xanthomonadales bacterium]